MMKMVKGLSRRTVLVRFPEAGLFEEALFVVREDRAVSKGVTAEDVISEACQIAQNHARHTSVRRRKHTWPAAVYTAAGALSVGIVWLLTAVFA